MTQKENWKTMSKLPDYAFSNLGRVKRLTECSRSHAGTILEIPGCGGYRRVKFNGKHYKVGLIIANLFIGKRPKGLELDHKNTVKWDDRADNLEWVTHLENMRRAFALGLRRHATKANGRAATKSNGRWTPRHIEWASKRNGKWRQGNQTHDPITGRFVSSGGAA